MCIRDRFGVDALAAGGELLVVDIWNVFGQGKVSFKLPLES